METLDGDPSMSWITIYGDGYGDGYCSGSGPWYGYYGYSYRNGNGFGAGKLETLV